jgi:hypothetical protein
MGFETTRFEGKSNPKRKSKLAHQINLEKQKIRELLVSDKSLMLRFNRRAHELGVFVKKEIKSNLHAKSIRNETILIPEKKKTFRPRSKKVDSKGHSRTFSDNSSLKFKRILHRRNNCIGKSWFFFC